MEVKKPALLIISTLIFVAIMGIIIYLFSTHPMGVDFTTYKELGPDQVADLSPLAGSNVTVRGIVKLNSTNGHYCFGDQKDIITYIHHKIEVEPGGKTIDRLESFGARNFIVDVKGKTIEVKGQAVQIFDPEKQIKIKELQNQYIDTVRENKEYSIFGTVIWDTQNRPCIEPFRITTASIADVKQEAAALNRSLSLKQYLAVFFTAAVYVFVLLGFKVFGPAEETAHNEQKPENK